MCFVACNFGLPSATSSDVEKQVLSTFRSLYGVDTNLDLRLKDVLILSKYPDINKIVAEAYVFYTGDIVPNNAFPPSANDILKRGDPMRVVYSVQRSESGDLYINLVPLPF